MNPGRFTAYSIRMTAVFTPIVRSPSTRPIPTFVALIQVLTPIRLGAAEYQRETEPTMNGILKWPWSQSLALSGEGDLCRVKEIFSTGIRTHLSQLGIREGSVLEYVGKDDAGVWIRTPGGSSVRVERDYTWFIVVEPTRMEMDGELN